MSKKSKCYLSLLNDSSLIKSIMFYNKSLVLYLNTLFCLFEKTKL